MIGARRVMTRGAVLAFCLVVLGSIAIVEEDARGQRVSPSVYYVNATLGNDNNGGLTVGTPFATIQKGIDAASGGDLILVYPGLYREGVDFLGKAITVQGVVVGPAGAPVLQNPGDFAVSFYSGEGRDSVLKNLVVRNSFMAVFIVDSSPTISNLTVVGNKYGIDAYSGSDPDIANTIFWNNSGADLFGCRARYSRVSDAEADGTNIDGDPLLVDPNAGDYHLFSERGRYWPDHDVWVLDKVTSPCVDAGDPNADPADEPVPNGGRINMGVYGGTEQASLSPSQQPGLPGQATAPSPADGEVDVNPGIVLRWTAGAGALSHQVYFGTDIVPPLVSRQDDGEFGREFHPGPLNLDTTYFWRIDEVNGAGKTTGVLWSFTTSRFQPKGRTCFTAETGVWVDGTLVPISGVRQGGCIAGTESATVTKSLPHAGKIQELQEHEGVFECYDVILASGNRIAVAERHFFLTQSGQWLAVQDLKPGMRLQTLNGSVGIVSVTKRPTPYVGKVYNLRIEGSDRYLVGEDAVVVRDY